MSDRKSLCHIRNIVCREEDLNAYWIKDTFNEVHILSFHHSEY
jgi:hypothetical protein